MASKVPDSVSMLMWSITSSNPTAVSWLSTSEPKCVASRTPSVHPHVDVLKPPGGTTAVVLVLHGGREHGQEPVRRHNLAYLRMVPLARALRAPGLEVWNLRYRVR